MKPEYAFYTSDDICLDLSIDEWVMYRLEYSKFLRPKNISSKFLGKSRTCACDHYIPPHRSFCPTVNMATAYVPPSGQRSLRACLVCSIVQPQSKFRTAGCPNCESFLEMIGNDDQILDCTSQVYEGLLTLADPQRSWVAKWQRLSEYVPGVYAVKVQGILPGDIVQTVEAAGVRYIP